MTPACKELNLIFKQSEQKLSDSLITYKTKVSNPYWGKIKDSGMFPRKSGTSIKIVKLGRSTIDPPRWQGVSDSYCGTNACDNPEQDIIYNGFETDNYSLAKTSFRTDWLCLDALVFREMPESELAHFEDNIRKASQRVWNEFGRSRYIHMCQNKVVATVDDADLTDVCEDSPKVKCNDQNIDTEGFVWARYAQLDGSDGEINENYVFVKVNPTKLENIALLSLDMLDVATEELETEDDTMPFADEGIQLFDVVLANSRMGNQFCMQEDRRMNNAISYGGYDPMQLKRTLGTKNVFRDRYSVRYDNDSARFYPDTVYNTALVEAGGYTYDATDPETWPRFKRVYRYIQQKSTSGEGAIWVSNKVNFLNAPFAISTIFSPGVCSIQGYPDGTSMGSAMKEGVGLKHNYAGNAVWHNPDWECNLDRNKGFWKVDFGAAVRPEKKELGYSYFHRVSRKISLHSTTCDIPTEECVTPYSPYCYEGMTGADEDLNGTSGQLRPMYRGPISII